nr:hypothetical protein [Escherichia coli]
MSTEMKTGLVLSGGGAVGAYQAGVVKAALQNASLKVWSMKYFRRGLHEYRNENGAGAVRWRGGGRLSGGSG